jgi:hypothetical protein
MFRFAVVAVLSCSAIWFVLRQRFGWASATHMIKLTANLCIAICSSTNAVSFSSGTYNETLPVAKRVYEVRPRKDTRGVDVISDALPFGRLWYDTPDNAIGYAMHSSRSYDVVIRAYDAAGNVIETHEHKGDFKGW